MKVTVDQNTVKEFGPIQFLKFHPNQNNSKIKNAILKQKVTTVFTPERTVGSSKSTGLVPRSEFGELKGDPITSVSNRVAFEPVPVDWTNKEVEELLNSNKEAKLYVIYSLHVKDVLSDEQINAAEGDFSNMTMDDYANNKAVRPSSEGDLILWNDKHVQYRACYYDGENKFNETVDKRDTDNVYLSPDLQVELEARLAELETQVF